MFNRLLVTTACRISSRKCRAVRRYAGGNSIAVGPRKEIDEAGLDEWLTAAEVDLEKFPTNSLMLVRARSPFTSLPHFPGNVMS